MVVLEKEKIRKEIYEKFGWTLKEWAKRRGLSYWAVYDLLRGKTQGKRVGKAREVLKALEEDLKGEMRRVA